MKKLLVLLLVATLILVGCGKKEPVVERTKAENIEPKQKENESEAKQEEAKKPSGIYFKDKTLVLEDITLEIIGAKMMKPGDVEHLDKPQLTIFFKLTNTSDKNLPIGSTWLIVTNATQETESIVVDLYIGNTFFRDERYKQLAENLYADLKPGGTVKALIPYELKYPDMPVTLTFTHLNTGKEVGKLVIDIPSD